MKPENAKYTFEELVQIMARLRDPVSGCPWDREQDFRTIAPYTLEEAYEVADAIDRNDMKDLQEELGDLLLQPVYHAQMASEDNAFTIEDVIDGIARKMVERHPHVFGAAEAKTADDVNSIWDQKKSREAERKSGGQKVSALDGLPPALPALLKAQKLQSKAAKVGFEWPDIKDVLDKLDEELGELNNAVAAGSIPDTAEELGDVLFVLVNLGRKMGINSEEALRQCNNKFERRFRGLELEFQSQDLKLSDLSLEEMTAGWDREKAKEKAI